jgi:hypothetical protein
MDFMSVIVGEALSLGEVLVPLLLSLIVIAQWEMTEIGLDLNGVPYWYSSCRL